MIETKRVAHIFPRVQSLSSMNLAADKKAGSKKRANTKEKAKSEVASSVPVGKES